METSSSRSGSSQPAGWLTDAESSPKPPDLKRQSPIWDHLGHDICFEILSLIASKRDLLSLSLVSRQTRKITEPFLYQSFTWTWQQGRSSPIVSLLNNILQRPQLAPHIHSVHLLGDEMCRNQYKWDDVPSIPTEELYMGPAIKLIRGSGVDFAQQWEQGLHNGSVDALVALLLSQLDNLRALTVGPSFAKHTTLFGLMLNAATTNARDYNLSGFGQLQEVFHEIDDWSPRRTNGRNTVDALPLLLLPALRELTVSLDNPIDLHWPFPNDRYSAVVSLSLTLVREAHLPRVLGATPKLKSLKWSLFYREDQEHTNNDLIIDLSKIGEGLTLVTETLESLIVSVLPDEGPSGEIQMKVRGSLKGLKACRTLRNIELPIEFLAASLALGTSAVLVDIVPVCIERILLTDDIIMRGYDENEQDMRLYNSVRSSLQILSRNQANLQAITLTLKLAEICWARPTRIDFKNLCDQYGVGVTFAKFREPLGWAWGDETVS